MQILLIGASGRTGQAVLNEAIERGHTVTALVRNSSSLNARRGLTIVQGTPLNVADVETAFRSSPTPPIAAIVTLASVRESDSPFAKQVSPARLMADSHQNVADVLGKHGVKNIVTLSADGVGESWGTMPWLTRWLFSVSSIRFAFEDHNAVYEEMREKVQKGEVEWTSVRPTRLVYADEKKVVRELGVDGKGQGLMSSTTVGSLVGVLMEETEKLEAGEKGRVFVVTN